MFNHSVGTEFEETWNRLFSSLKGIPGFDDDNRVTVVDQEKSIDTTCHNHMEYAHLFLDPIHVKNNMACAIVENTSGISIYDKAVHEPSQTIFNYIKRQFGQRTSNYLSKFPDCEFYRAFSRFQDRLPSSKGAESDLYA